NRPLSESHGHLTGRKVRAMKSNATIDSDSTRTASKPTQTVGDSAAAKLPFTQFIWGAGIECSFLPHLNVDQFQWTQHNRFWREDFRRAKQELGINHLRYAFPWHVLEPEPGKFDWSYSHERVDELKNLGIDVMLD